jgi:chromosome segregation and condensation protein ScpB
MNFVTIELPEELARALASSGGDLSRAALEALATEAYREQKISHCQLRRILGFETRMELDAFLKARGLELEYTAEDLERDRATLNRLGA